MIKHYIFTSLGLRNTMDDGWRSWTVMLAEICKHLNVPTHSPSINTLWPVYNLPKKQLDVDNHAVTCQLEQDRKPKGAGALLIFVCNIFRETIVHTITYTTNNNRGRQTSCHRMQRHTRGPTKILHTRHPSWCTGRQQ